MSLRAYTSRRHRDLRSSTTGSALTPESNNNPKACVNGVAGVTMCSGCSLRHWRLSLLSGSTPAWATPASGDHVPTPNEPSGWPSNGREAREARKWRMRQASTADRVARCKAMGISLPPGSALRIGAMLHLWCVSVCTTLAISSSGFTYTKALVSRPDRATSSRNPLMVCASISASLSGLAPACLMLFRSWVRMLMKSEALMTLLMLDTEESHTGAEAIPCSWSAWKACRIGKSASRTTTFPLSGINS
mmetsp:Transcript_18894/g.52933  ORF Transcript_18894/g.52933 Transcript_18894/m.52933 type:complete len:248 (-) Transcript_18894:794-1537(-)